MSKKSKKYTELSFKLRKLQAKASKLEQAYRDEIGEAMVELARLADAADKWEWCQKNLKKVPFGGIPDGAAKEWTLTIPADVGKWHYADAGGALSALLRQERVG